MSSAYLCDHRGPTATGEYHTGSRGRQAGKTHGIDARSAIQYIVTASSVQRIVTGSPINAVVSAVSRQDIVMGTAQQVRYVGIGVARRITGVVACITHIRHDTGCRGLIARPIDRTRLPDQGIGTGTTYKGVVAIAIERIVTASAIDDIDIGIAGERVSQIAPQQILDVEYRCRPPHRRYCSPGHPGQH